MQYVFYFVYVVSYPAFHMQVLVLVLEVRVVPDMRGLSGHCTFVWAVTKTEERWWHQKLCIFFGASPVRFIGVVGVASIHVLSEFREDWPPAVLLVDEFGYPC